MKSCLRDVEHAFYEWEFVRSVESLSSDSLQVNIAPPLSADEFIAKLPSLFIPSFIKAIQCGMPLEYRILGGNNESLVLKAANTPFDIIHWTLAQHTSEYEELSSESLKSQDCSVALLANVQDFPNDSISLFHFSNHTYRSSTTDYVKNLLQSLHGTEPFSRLGITVSSPADEFSTQSLPTIDYAPPMSPTAQFWYKRNATRNSSSPELRNLVVFIFDSYRRSSSDLPLMIARALRKCASQLDSEHPLLFKSPVAVQMPIASIPPISSATSSALPNRLKKIAKSKTSPKPKDPPKRTSAIANGGSNQNISHDQKLATTDSSNPFTATPSTVTSKPNAKGSVLPSTSQGSPSTLPPNHPSLKAAPSSQKDPPSARQAKRKRPAPRDDESIAQEKDLYISSIVDSLSSIVTISPNPDFVTACLAKVGLSPSTDLSQQHESAERRMEDFRRIVERNLRCAVDLSQRQRKAVVNASGRTEHALSLEELVEDEEMEWIDGLSETEIESLWTPTPSLPSDAKWHEALWVPCTIMDLNESAFHHIVM